jgi:hypothetical protein
MTRVSLRPRPAIGLAALLILVACNASPSVSTGPTQSASTTTPAAATPTPAPPTPTVAPTPSATPAADSTVAIVKIEQQGGMLPLWDTLRFYPSIAVYSDGRLITQGPMIDIYPGPALPNLQVTHLTQAGVDQVLAWAEEAGLKGPDRQLGEIGFDAGSTLVTVTHPDGVHHTTVADMTASTAEVGAVAQFQQIMLDLRTWLPNDVGGDDEPYTFDRLRVISSLADPASVVNPELSSTLEWPLDEPLGTLGTSISEPANYRCASVEGEDLAALMPLLQQANELTMWQSEDALYQLNLRPLLPDEEACPGL